MRANSLPGFRHAARTGGFSLVEIAAALGIVSIAIVSTLALLAGSNGSQKSAAFETNLVFMAEQITNAFRSMPFDRLYAADPLDPTVSLPAVPEDSVFYFTRDARLIKEDDPLFKSEVLYECRVKKTPDLFTPALNNDGPANLLRLQLIFQSPPDFNPASTGTPVPSSSVDARLTRTLHLSIARYAPPQTN